MAAFLLLLAIIGGVVLADLVRENPTATEVTVFGHPVSGHSQGWLLAMTAALGILITLLLVASLGSTRARRARRKQLRWYKAELRRRRAEPQGSQASLLDDLFGHDKTAGGLGEPTQPPT